MKKFIHPNIVSMLGMNRLLLYTCSCDHHDLLGHCEATSDGAPMMILELMQYGDLKWFLKANR